MCLCVLLFVLCVLAAHCSESPPLPETVTSNFVRAAGFASIETARQVWSPSIESCAFACLQETRCRGFDFMVHADGSQNTPRCGLLTHATDENNGGLVEEPDWDHFERQAPQDATTDQAADQAQQLYALQRFYNATNGHKWTSNNLWLSDRPFCRWEGVSCSSDGNVWKLSLQRKDVTGTIPTQIAALGHLTDILLNDNNLVGTLPSQLGLLSQLSHLDISFNHALEGTLPVELVHTNLSSIELSYNSFVGSIPTSFFTSLQFLVLFRAERNRLEGTLPTQLGLIARLEELDLDGNRVVGTLPSQISGLSRLRSLELSNNKLTGSVPTEIGALNNLVTLALNNNGFVGAIPSQLGQLSVSLHWADFSNNQLSGMLPSQLAHLGGLSWLDVSDNHELTGPVPRLTSGLQCTNTGISGCPTEARDASNNTLRTVRMVLGACIGLVVTLAAFLVVLVWKEMHGQPLFRALPQSDLGDTDSCKHERNATKMSSLWHAATTSTSLRAEDRRRLEDSCATLE